MIITATNQLGQLTTATSSIPVVLQNGGGINRSSGSNAGAIAGGVVGGLVALSLLLGLVWFLRKRGYFGRSDEDQFTDDMWAPGRHPADDADPVGVVGGAGAGGINNQYYEGVGAEMSEQGHVRPLSTQWHPSHGYYEGQYSDGHPQQYDREIMGSGQPYSDPGVGVGPMGSQHSHYSNTRGMDSGTNYAHEAQNISPSSAYPDRFPSDGQPSPQQTYSPANPAPLAYGPPRRNNTIGSISDYGHYSSDLGCQTEATTGSTTEHSPTAPDYQDLPPMPNTHRLSLGAGMGQAFNTTTNADRPDLQIMHHSTGSSSSSSNSNPSVHTLLSSANTSLPPSPSGHSKEEPTMFAGGLGMGMVGKMLDRRESTESLIMPSQFLGARVVNQSTPREEKSFDWGDSEG